MDPFEINPVGRVESQIKDRDDAPKQGDEGAPDAWIVLEPGFGEAAMDLKPGDRIVGLTWLDRADRTVQRNHSRGDSTRPLIGVFGNRSPDRPNPIGLHTVTVVEADGLRILVSDLEAFDGTPVLDLKAELPPIDER